jgi:hypothetical protein
VWKVLLVGLIWDANFWVYLGIPMQANTLMMSYILHIVCHNYGNWWRSNSFHMLANSKHWHDNLKLVKVSSFAIYRQDLLLCRGWFVIPISQTLFCIKNPIITRKTDFRVAVGKQYRVSYPKEGQFLFSNLDNFTKWEFKILLCAAIIDTY